MEKGTLKLAPQLDGVKVSESVTTPGRDPVLVIVTSTSTESPGASGPTMKLTIPVAGRVGPVICAYDGDGGSTMERLVTARVRVPAPSVTVRVPAEVNAEYPTPVVMSAEIIKSEKATLRLIMSRAPKRRKNRGGQGDWFTPCPLRYGHRDGRTRPWQWRSRSGDTVNCVG